MKSNKKTAFDVMIIAASIVLLTGTPIIAGHQALAISFWYGYGKALHSIYIGPCVNWVKYMYLICNKIAENVTAANNVAAAANNVTAAANNVTAAANNVTAAANNVTAAK